VTNLDGADQRDNLGGADQRDNLRGADQRDNVVDEGLEGAVLELEVGSVAHGGHCVARAPEGHVVFVRHALPGETVRAVVTEQRKGFLRADAVEVLVASPRRAEPPCPWAGPNRCGGCDFQHATPSYQRELKADVVREQLTRLAGLTFAEVDALDVRVRALPDVPGQPEGLGWRTRVQYTVDAVGRAGLLKHRSHEVVAVDRCLIAHPEVQAAPVLGKNWPDLDHIEVVASAGGDLTLLGSRAKLPRPATSPDSKSPRPATSPDSKGQPKPVSGPQRVEERALGREWSVPADSFWQVHPAAADTLAATVVELLAPRSGERAWDLYGGAGLFAAALAPHLDGTGRLTVVESDPKAAGAAQRCLRDLTTVTVLRSDVERALANPRWRGVDLVVLDPPRAGAGRAVVEAIIARSPRAVAYVACDPAALARDVKTFRDAGWQLSVLRAFDLFPNTHHVECVALLQRSNDV
jgi:tRNA/tmRNA/rRNA uracil-C5-methylase (TrmA/RlmC/RlmD family)